MGQTSFFFFFFGVRYFCMTNLAVVQLVSCVFDHLPEFAQMHSHGVSDAIQPAYPVSPPSPSAFSLSQYQGVFQ